MGQNLTGKQREKLWEENVLQGDNSGQKNQQQNLGVLRKKKTTVPNLT